MGVNFQNTSDSEGFNIFEKLSTEDIVCGGHNNILNLYILKIHDKLFSYDKLYEYILDNICQYVFNRRKNLEVQNDSKKARRLVLEALDHLREINSDKDLGAGGELGEILLYLFLEQDLQAPKLFSKVELKTSTNDYVKGADGIHFKIRIDIEGNKILQLVVGEAKVKNELKDGIEEAFTSINTYLTSNSQDVRLLDTHLMNQLVEDDEAEILKRYLLGQDVEDKETVFGIFIGYSINYDGLTDNNDNYKQNIKQANLKQVLEYKQKIIGEIEKYNISNYQFNFYFLPFHNAQRKYYERYIDIINKGMRNEELGEVENAIFDTFENEYYADYMNDILEQRARAANKNGKPLTSTIQQYIEWQKSEPGRWERIKELAEQWDKTGGDVSIFQNRRLHKRRTNRNDERNSNNRGTSNGRRFQKEIKDLHKTSIDIEQKRIKRGLITPEQAENRKKQLKSKYYIPMKTGNAPKPLYLTCDFNVDPMCWCLAHMDEKDVFFFDELVIENTSTQACIEEFIRRYPNHRSKIVICGDASGDFRNAQSEFTNYMIIRRALEAHGYSVDFKIRPYNPPVLRRIQAFNARVCNAAGERHIFVDPKKCKWLMHNIYNLTFKEGTSIVDIPTVKQIKNDREAKFLEHIFDAASYLIEYFFPIK